ncbi:MAG: S8 family peptidase [Pirellulaceae bacterium]
MGIFDHFRGQHAKRQRTEFHGVVETLESRSMMTADLVVSGIWFEDVAGHDFVRDPEGSLGTESYQSDTGEQSSVGQHDWIVQLTHESASELTSVADALGYFTHHEFQLNVVRGLGQVGQLLVRTTDADAATVSDWFSSLDVIAQFEQDLVSTQEVVPSDPSYASQPNLPQIEAPAAWDYTTGSSEVIVAVIDTGVDYTHPDLASNMWVNPYSSGVNGFVGDVHGYNFVSNTGDPMDDNHHGTHVAGTIAAAGNNGQGISGVAWNTSIMALKTLSASGSGYTSDAVRAVNYVTMMRTQFDVNVRVINASWGGTGYSAALDSAIQASADAGILFVSAAGNSGGNNDWQPHYPSNYDSPNMISVAATNSNGDLASFSNYGQSTVHIAAPGVGIRSTVIGGGYAQMSGTSMAAPHVTGVAALAFALKPDATMEEVRAAILEGGNAATSLQYLVSSGSQLSALGTLEHLSVGGGTPIIGSLTAMPDPVRLAQGDTITMVAGGLDDVDGSIQQVYFYADTNGNGQWDAADQVMGQAAPSGDATATVTFNNPFGEAGTFQLFARAVDNQGIWSSLSTTEVLVVSQDDHANGADGATSTLSGQALGGAIDYRGDTDWYALEVVAGHTYTLETTLSGLYDSVLVLYGSDGATKLSQDDDGGLGYASKITWTATTSETLFAQVRGWGPSDLGSYTLTISGGPITEAPPLNQPEMDPPPAEPPSVEPEPVTSHVLELTGTAAGDSLTIDLRGDQWLITLNGVTNHYDAAQYQNVRFDGLSGINTVILIGGEGGNLVTMTGPSVRLERSGFEIETTATQIQYYLGSAEDIVRFVETTTQDTYGDMGQAAWMTDQFATYYSRATGGGTFERIDIDQAQLAPQPISTPNADPIEPEPSLAPPAIPITTPTTAPPAALAFSPRWIGPEYRSDLANVSLASPSIWTSPESPSAAAPAGDDLAALQAVLAATPELIRNDSFAEQTLEIEAIPEEEFQEEVDRLMAELDPWIE